MSCHCRGRPSGTTLQQVLFLNTRQLLAQSGLSSMTTSISRICRKVQLLVFIVCTVLLFNRNYSLNIKPTVLARFVAFASHRAHSHVAILLLLLPAPGHCLVPGLFHLLG